MTVKLADLSEKLGVSPDELKKKAHELGFEIKPRARTLEDTIAMKLEESFGGQSAEPDGSEESPPPIDDLSDASPKDTADAYDDMMSEELEREVVKAQRKQTAGKKVAPKKQHTQKEEQRRIATGEVEIGDAITVKEFSEKTGLNPIKIIGELMKNGILANINQVIDFETASIIADDNGIKLKRKRSEAKVEDISAGNLESLIKEDDAELLQLRPPIVTVMGHVDHGKTSILDAIREANVVSTESGGITQHIGAYQIEKDGKKITFIDTPGHEAFTEMRARGAKVTDIAVLVVAADDGVKPQTIEAMNHAKDAEVPIIVAINKMDKEGAQPDRVKAQLAEHELQPEDWGGKTIMVPVSALTGEGIQDLLDMILLTADVEDLKANPNRPAVGTVVESHLDKSLGPVATILVNTGTLRIQDPFVVGDTWGRVKTMHDHKKQALKEAGPSQPVRIAGLDATPHVGDVLQVVPNLEAARKKSEAIELMRKKEDSTVAANSMSKIINAIRMGKMKQLKVVLKADTLGSLEAIKQSLAKIEHEEVTTQVIHSGVGEITESDVRMAQAANAVLIGFHVLANAHVKDVADRQGVQIQIYQVIYELIDVIKKLLSGLLDPEVVEVSLGKALVKQVFLTEKKYMIVGCKVTNGLLQAKTRMRVYRNNELIGEGFLESLRHNKDQVKEMKEGGECGVKYEGKVQLEVGDILESWKEEHREKTVT
ncbi:translation initiation factor IF-2 [Candidatus Peregrinibacteria bacterium CG11_big_fil_rev_8_21_14_0_20_46_8]|nr:MAG: translation initiation factor IF-2 [Candidatus Peregrinibacteria bacterium CG11_big_fil_rev_8_21_14_0_20_46_8]